MIIGLIIHSYMHVQEWLRNPSSFQELDEKSQEVESFNYAREEYEANYRGDVLVPAQYSN